jgi:2-C-methyl-D-erythritol 4-phosphate cytidylyltransferase
MRYWLVMPAAGVGRRFGDQTPKQYADLHGRTVIEWALAVFLADQRCEGAAVVIASGDPHWPAVARRLSESPLPEVPGWSPPEIITAPGGTDRASSVRNGLAALGGRAQPDDWVLVHDAARPCISAADRDRLLVEVHSHSVGGLLAAPAADTLKRVTAAQEITETIDRSCLWRALTPQMFRYELLCQALDKALAAGRSPTDEAQAVEWMGERPLVVEGSASNIKITSAADLVTAAALLGVQIKAPGPTLKG